MDIALAQINPTVGDLKSNAAIIAEYFENSTAGLTIFPEMALLGYPPEDLLLNNGFLQQAQQQLELLATATNPHKAMIVGTAVKQYDKIYNAAAFLKNGQVECWIYKQNLPNTGVFDEKRYFEAGKETQVLRFQNKNIAVLICEDLWTKSPSAQLVGKNLDMLIVLNASPFETDKHARRLKVAKQRAQETNLPIVYVNMVGGQDELVFDGHSFVMTAAGELILEMPGWESCLGHYNS